MTNLKAKPYCLSDEDVQWVQNTIASMTDEEKVGQLFFQLTAGIDEAYLKELMEKPRRHSRSRCWPQNGSH